ncbi:hypothetical protein CEXT_78541 [Caerostris extrusa]|uniref:Uncharacterized protein n=1 Tax=Caerostris extrusa TaxID=172846 RepID=A0AAV4YA92_CAEEX|nr:hypothetical protein CEXT_78541 [Caerostris extrusa]
MSLLPWCTPSRNIISGKHQYIFSVQGSFHFVVVSWVAFEGRSVVFSVMTTIAFLYFCQQIDVRALRKLEWKSSLPIALAEVNLGKQGCEPCGDAIVLST